MDDRFDLTRFVDAQLASYDQALQELQAGRKRSHWMWFVFPQIAGLGLSPLAQRYAIRSLDEAQAYLRHPLLGKRLRACTAAVNQHPGQSAHDIFGIPDDVKFRSSMTLFGRIRPRPSSAAPWPPFSAARRTSGPSKSSGWPEVRHRNTGPDFDASSKRHRAGSPLPLRGQRSRSDRISSPTLRVGTKPLRKAQERFLGLERLCVGCAGQNASWSRAGRPATHTLGSHSCPPTGRTLFKMSRQRRLPFREGERVLGEAQKGREFSWAIDSELAAAVFRLSPQALSYPQAVRFKAFLKTLRVLALGQLRL